MHRNSIKPDKSQELVRKVVSSKQSEGQKTPPRRLLSTYCFLFATPRLPLSILCSLSGLTVIAGVLFARPAFADPHAVFYTDRGQEQVFYNVLAALNQADYVEEPGRPPVQLSREIGRYIRTGVLPAPRPSPFFVPQFDSAGRLTGFQRSPPVEPSEAVELPRLRVRQVTPDDGDVYTREALARRALVEAQRVELSNLLCNLVRMYRGEEASRECEAQERAHNLTGA